MKRNGFVQGDAEHAVCGFKIVQVSTKELIFALGKPRTPIFAD
jgi:hypothetical protein